MKKSRNKKAFTLVEVVITITLIAILSAISVPIYKDYIYKAQLTEGYTLCAKIRDAQIQYYNEYGYFISAYSSYGNQFTCYDKVLDIDARANKYFTEFCSNRYYFTDMTSLVKAIQVFIKNRQGSQKTMLYNITQPVEYYGFE
ncbi:MAG: prepilin-type N-terminal cleavage/methylation domain-containing protein [Elusimicrobia bacterium]|nr:prepilin-type N-terminal cleavage/methylation domain-containing protein [Elusimicrobiota bacterium]